MDTFNEKPATYKTKGLSNTYQFTLDLVKSGKKPTEIAKERSMTLDTIYNHLSKLVTKGLVDIEKIIDTDRIETIRKVLDNVDEGISSTAIKEVLGDAFSYGEIRLVRAAMSYLP